MAREIIFQTRDSHGELSVEQDATSRSLYFGTRHRQTRMDLLQPTALLLEYTQVMVMSLLFSPQPRRALVVGLGGGALVKFLLRHCPGCRVDVVELRPAVVDVAHRFFDVPKQDPRLRVHTEDGAQFLVNAAARTPRLYDLIFVDAFDAHGPATAVMSLDTLRACRQLVSLSGAVVLSDWVHANDDYPERRRTRGALFEQHALTLALGHDHANVVNFFFRRPIAQMPMAQILVRATRAQREFGFNSLKYLHDIARQNFMSARPRQVTAAVS